MVPYNTYLTKRYKCQIKVEICISDRAIKYLYMYVTKGPSLSIISAEVGDENGLDIIDEINQFEDLHSIGSSEAAWDAFAFLIAENKSPVQVI